MSTCRPSIGVAMSGHADAVEEQLPLAAQVVHGVRRERLELDGEPGAGLLHRGRDGRLVLHDALGDQPVAVVHRAVHAPGRRAPRRARARPGPRSSTSGDARLDQDVRPEVRVAARGRPRGVEHGGGAAGGERLGRDAVEVEVVDDRDLTGPQALGQVLGPGVDPHQAVHPGLSGGQVAARRSRSLIAGHRPTTERSRSSAACWRPCRSPPAGQHPGQLGDPVRPVTARTSDAVTTLGAALARLRSPRGAGPRTPRPARGA